MRLHELTLPTPEENLAYDEALLAWCDDVEQEDVLRFWHPSRYFIALGYGNRVSTEVNVEFCQRNTIPILRRCTGGGTVLQGPGCLNYALILRYEGQPKLQGIHNTNEFILRRHQEALSNLIGAPVEKQGHTDLAVGGLKFSGNAQRRGRRFLLFHGAFLLHMDLELLERTLLMPSRQPEYRLNRSHRDFLMNLKVPESAIQSALRQAWKAEPAAAEVPYARLEALVREKYASEQWNLKFR